MDVQTILETKGDNVVTVTADETVSDAARLLIANNIGVVVVTDGVGRLAGIVSERDISRAVADQDGALSARPVRELMNTRVFTCRMRDSIVDTITLMNANRIRHLPVVESDRLVGIVSMRDISDVWQCALEKEIERLHRSLNA